MYKPGDAELDTLSSILSSGKDSRLYKALVQDKQLAQDISAYQVSMFLGSFYVVEATASSGIDPDLLVVEIDTLLENVRENGVTENEVELAKINWEAAFYRGLRSISSKGNRLNQYYIQTGDTNYIQKDLDRFLSVTPEGVLTAAKGLGKGRIVLHIGPEDETQEEGK